MLTSRCSQRALGLIGQLFDVIRPGHAPKPTPKPKDTGGYSAMRSRGGGSWRVR